MIKGATVQNCLKNIAGVFWWFFVVINSRVFTYYHVNHLYLMFDHKVAPSENIPQVKFPWSTMLPAKSFHNTMLVNLEICKTCKNVLRHIILGNPTPVKIPHAKNSNTKVPSSDTHTLALKVIIFSNTFRSICGYIDWVINSRSWCVNGSTYTCNYENESKI